MVSWWVGNAGASNGVLRGFSKITQKSIKPCVGVGRRPKSGSLEVFLDSMDRGLSFDVYYSPGDPLGAALEFFENREISRTSVVRRA